MKDGPETRSASRDRPLAFDPRWPLWLCPSGPPRTGCVLGHNSGEHGEKVGKPDGRATWEYGPERRPGTPHAIWRRVGTHAIFDPRPPRPPIPPLAPRGTRVWGSAAGP